MLRTLGRSEPELFRLCRSKKWIAVSLRSQSHDTEATPSEMAIRGEGSTVLAMAIRSGAPRSVLQALVQANLHQVGTVHGQRGTILHEAMKHRLPVENLRFLLQAAIRYERFVLQKKCCYYNKIPSVLGRQDSMGRTALHYMVERALQELLRDQDDTLDVLSRSTWVLFQSLVLSYPPAIHTMDCDGNTPLVQLLLVTGRVQQVQQHHRRAQISDQLEAMIFHMVQLLVATCPSTAIISRRLPRSFRCCAHHNFVPKTKRPHVPNKISIQSQLIGDGAPNPLSYALLYQRSINTIQLLLDANRKVGVRGCMTIVSHYHEVPLHIAVTMRVAIPILAQLVQYGPGAVLVSDAHGLTPLDWCWVRHVLDWFTPVAERDHVPASKRRHVATLFANWHERVTNHLATTIAVSDNLVVSAKALSQPSSSSSSSSSSRWSSRPRPSPITRSSSSTQQVHSYSTLASAAGIENSSSILPLTELHCDLWHRMQILLPMVAQQLDEAFNSSKHLHLNQRQQQSGGGAVVEHAAAESPWSILHAACFVSCPLAMVRLALEHSSIGLLACLDTRMSRLPLHYAAAHRVVGYVAQVPVGFTNEHMELIVEPSPIPYVISKWSPAARITDGEGQLPLHIAIDAFKAKRQKRQNDGSQQQEQLPMDDDEENDVHYEEDGVMVDLLLAYYPEAVERRDGKTKLFPFQQAAVGEGASLNTIFTLLMRQPTLVETALNNNNSNNNNRSYQSG